jgi:hypothetical protein
MTGYALPEIRGLLIKLVQYWRARPDSTSVLIRWC